MSIAIAQRCPEERMVSRMRERAHATTQAHATERLPAGMCATRGGLTSPADTSRGIARVGYPFGLACDSSAALAAAVAARLAAAAPDLDCLRWCVVVGRRTWL